MKDFPIILRILAVLCLLPALWGMSFYLFGAVQPFGTSQSKLMQFLLYMAAQLLWAVPVATFFVSLNEHRRGYTTRAYIYASLGVALGVASFVAMLIQP